MAIATGLVYNILMCLACVSLWRGLQIQSGDRDPRSPTFSLHILDPFFSDPFPKVLSRLWIHFRLFLAFLRNILIAPFTLAKVSSRLHGKSAFWPTFVGLSLLLSFTVVLNLCQSVIFKLDGAWSLAIVVYVIFSFLTGVLRGQVRDRLDISGSCVEDFLVSLILYPSVALQVDLATEPLNI